MGGVMKHVDVMLRPDPSRTVIRPFLPGDPAAFEVPGKPRARRIVDRILALGHDEVDHQWQAIGASLDERHRDVDKILERRFEEVARAIGRVDADARQRRLIGAYFSEEYAFEAAALFNPSVILHPEPGDVPAGSVRFAMSLRGIGEGHISSVTFRTGTWTPGKTIEVDPPSEIAVAPIIEGDDNNDDGRAVQLRCGGSQSISETVLFPVLPSQRQGIEDLRITRFVEDDGEVAYFGTYTAFSGAEVRSELLTGHDFRSFEMRALRGAAAAAKGMALFPRRIGGRYAMLGRQDNENVWLLYSDDLLTWEGGEKLLTPAAPWEIVQVGNCGPPIEIDEGWLVLTHGVGTVRNYCIGAALLDRDDPSKVLARTKLPLLEPDQSERDGYVPNVVYSCGGLVHERTLLLPYGVADSYTTFATAGVDDVLGMMG